MKELSPYYESVDNGYQRLSYEEVVEDLQKEIERLNKCYCNRSDCAGRLNQKNEVYDSVVQRNEKAIEYIEKNSYTTYETIDDINYFIVRLDTCDDLLNILKGVDKE